MFDDKLFDEWLDSQSKLIFTRLTAGESLRPEETIILVLKAQTNHFAHLDQDLRQEMIQLRVDMDKRFEQVDKRFDEIVRRMDRFMFWSLGITVPLPYLSSIISSNHHLLPP
jgi:hypothetical protein